MIYDTLKLSKALRTSFTPEQAETLASAFSASTEDTVATKTDIAILRAEIKDLRSELKTDIANLKVDMADMKVDLANMKVDMATMRTDMASMKTDLVRWIVTAIAFNLLATVGLMIVIARLVAK